jgi:hypothetical protein
VFVCVCVCVGLLSYLIERFTMAYMFLQQACKLGRKGVKVRLRSEVGQVTCKYLLVSLNPIKHYSEFTSGFCTSKR